MELPEITLRGVAVTLGYLVLGAIATAAAATGALLLLQPIQAALYDVVYLELGPSGATEFALLVGFVLAGAIGLAISTLAGEFLSAEGANLRPILVATGGMAALVALFAAVSLAGPVGLLVALVWLLVVALGVPFLLRFRYGVDSGGIPAFVGGVPVVAFLLLLAGFGLGWGWGYVLTAEAVPASAVDDADVASFDDVPQVREDLFAGDCSGTADGGEVCYLSLRGYEHEETAVRFLAAHGVRCPYQGSTAEAGSFVARHGDAYYRVSCASHGD